MKETTPFISPSLHNATNSFLFSATPQTSQFDSTPRNLEDSRHSDVWTGNFSVGAGETNKRRKGWKEQARARLGEAKGAEVGMKCGALAKVGIESGTLASAIKRKSGSITAAEVDGKFWRVPGATTNTDYLLSGLHQSP